MDESLYSRLNDHFDKYETVAYPKGKIITLAGQDPKHILFLLDGVVEQYDITPEGNKVTVNVFKPRAFFPMSWAINKTPNAYFYAALTDITVKRANADETVAFLQHNPDITFDLLSRVYRGTDALLKRLVLAASGVAASRLIFELLIEAYRFGTDTGEKSKSVKIKQLTLAARSGLARETVSRELSKLEKEGLIHMSTAGIIVHAEELEKRLDVNV
jgi:CRP-like cAMP-binding protein